MPAELHYGDIGTVIRITVNEDNVAKDVSGATAKAFKFRKPSGATVNKNASFETDGTDGVLRYVTADGDLDEAGLWRVQVLLEIGTGSWSSDIAEFRVDPNL